MNPEQVTNEKEFWAFMAKLSEERERRYAQLEMQLAKTDAQLAKTDAQLAKTDAQLAKTDEKLNKLAKLFGDVNNNRGEEAEEFFFRSLKRNPRIGEMTFHTIHRNLSGDQNNIVDEFDLILVNGNALALIEVKSKAHLNLVDNMIDKKIPNLRKLFPMFKGYKVYAGIASLVTYPELIKKTTEKGLFLLTQHGKHLEIVSPSLYTF